MIILFFNQQRKEQTNFSIIFVRKILDLRIKMAKGISHNDTEIYTYDKEEKILKIHKISDGNENCSYPWNKYKSEVKKIIIDDKITNIPEKAFTNCYHLLEINVPTQCIVAQNALQIVFLLTLSML